MNTQKNLRHGIAVSHWMYAIPVLLLPLSAAGVVLPSRWDLEAVRAEGAHLRQVEEELERSKAALAEFGYPETLATLQSIQTSLHALIPDELTDAEIFSYLQRAASSKGIQMDAMRFIEDLGPDALGLEGGIAARVVHISGLASIADLVAMLCCLHGEGLPVALLAVDLRRERIDKAEYQFECDVAVLHRAAPSRSKTSAAGLSEVMPGGE